MLSKTADLREGWAVLSLTSLLLCIISGALGAILMNAKRAAKPKSVLTGGFSLTCASADVYFGTLSYTH